ncbi:MAG: hypothetical protein U1E76_24430 [Planctomycetota bacterium]
MASTTWCARSTLLLVVSEAVWCALHGDQALAEPDPQAVRRDHALEQGEHLLLVQLLRLDLAVQRQGEGLQQRELLARIMEQRAAERGLLLEQRVTQLHLVRLERRGNACRSTAHHHHVERLARPRTRARQPAGNRGDRRRALLDGIADQRDPTQLADHEQARHARFVLGGEHRHVRALGQRAEPDRDRAHRACLRAQPMAHAARAVHDHGAAMQHPEHAILRTRRHAQRAACAQRRVDERVLIERPVAATTLGVGELALDLDIGRLLRGPLQPGDQVQQHGEPGGGDEDRDQHGCT